MTLRRLILSGALFFAVLSLAAPRAEAQVTCPPVPPPVGEAFTPTPIPCLPNGSTPSGTEVIPAYQSGREVKLTTAQIMQAAESQIAGTRNVISAATAASLMTNFGGL